MEKNNKLEIVGFGLMVIGGLFWLSRKFYFVESLSPAYGLSDIVLPIGLFIWALGYMKKESLKRKRKESE